MTSLQKVIKYCAIAFAIILAIGIMSFVVNAVFGVVTFTSGWNYTRKNMEKIETVDFSETFRDVKSLDIDHSTGSLKIMVGDTFQVDADNVFEGFTAKVTSNGTLSVNDNESNFRFFGFNFRGFNSPNSKITVYVPADFIAEEVKIDTGAGSVTMKDLTTEYLYVSAGAGNINGSNLTAEEVKFEGGVGSVNLDNVNFMDADFNCGVGNLDIEGILLGDSKFDCGVGEVDLDLVGDIDDYDLDIDSGVGTVRLNGEKMNEKKRRNNFADHTIEVDGGVGSVRIDINN